MFFVVFFLIMNNTYEENWDKKKYVFVQNALKQVQTNNTI